MARDDALFVAAGQQPTPAAVAAGQQQQSDAAGQQPTPAGAAGQQKFSAVHGQQPTPCAADSPWVLSAAKIEQWAVAARPGDQLVYAAGYRLLRTEGAEAVARLSDEGEVRCNFRRGPGGIGQYLATRLAAPVRVERSRQLLHRDADEAVQDEAARLMIAIRRAVNFNRPCPTNKELAAQADLKTPQQASYQLSKLISAGLIRIVTLTDGRRVMCVTATGKKTAPSVVGVAR